MVETTTTSILDKRIKRQIIGKPHRFKAVAPLGFEGTLAKELNNLGIATDSVDNNNSPHIVADGKVEFTAKITEAWKAVAYSRIANRVLMEVDSFKAENFGQLEKRVAAVPWELFLPSLCHPEQRATKSRACPEFAEENLEIHVTCKHSRLYHSGAIEERVRKIIEQHFDSHCERERCEAIKAEPSSSSQHLYVNLQDDHCTLWLDLAGEELYKRGHERFVAEAPLKETIAAAMIFEAAKIAQSPAVIASDNSSNVIASENFRCHPREKQCPLSTYVDMTLGNGDEDLAYPITIVDPMAGSGTFSLEAAYIANGLIPGMCRDFALKHQPAFKEGTWNFILKCSSNVTASNNSSNVIANEAKQLKKNRPAVSIITSDISERPIDIIKHNVDASPLPAGVINPQLKDFFSYTLEDLVNESFHHATDSQQTSNDSRNAGKHIVILLNPPYGKRLSIDAPKLYARIGEKLSTLAQELRTLVQSDAQAPHDIDLTVAMLAPKDDTREGAHYTCTSNLLQACPALDPSQNAAAKLIETSHGGFSLNAIFSKI